MATNSPTHFTAIPRREKLTFTFLDSSKDNNETITEQFWGYFKGSGCPVPIVMELDNINIEYENDYPDPSERESLGDAAYIAKARRANFIRFRDMLVTVVPGLSMEVANVLVSPDDDGNAPGLAALEYLGYRQPLVETADANEGEASDDDKGEVQRVDETGQLPLQIPMPSIQD